MKKLEKLLIKLRKKIKMSQRCFSKKYGFSQGHISRIERKKIKNPRKITIKKLEKLFKSNNIK